jgi:hypothetical protein
MYKWIVISRPAYYNKHIGNLTNNIRFFGGILLGENKDDLIRLEICRGVIDKCYFNKRISCYDVFLVFFIHEHNVMDFYFKS